MVGRREGRRRRKVLIPLKGWRVDGENEKKRASAEGEAPGQYGIQGGAHSIAKRGRLLFPPANGGCQMVFENQS